MHRRAMRFAASQVLCQQRLLAERLEERRALEAQLEAALPAGPQGRIPHREHGSAVRSAAEQGLVRDRDEQKSVQQKDDMRNTRAFIILQVTISAFFSFSFLLCRREEPSALPRRSSK